LNGTTESVDLELWKGRRGEPKSKQKDKTEWGGSAIGGWIEIRMDACESDVGAAHGVDLPRLFSLSFSLSLSLLESPPHPPGD
jgi:hypothetical protein